MHLHLRLHSEIPHAIRSLDVTKSPSLLPIAIVGSKGFARVQNTETEH